MGGELALVPWADMLNHKPGCAAFIDLDDDSVNLTTDRAYNKGEQVWASYGQRPSSELLISYGFAPRLARIPTRIRAQLGMASMINAPKRGSSPQRHGSGQLETFPLRLNGYPVSC